MSQVWKRALAGGVVGAIVGFAALMLIVGARPAVTISMDGDLPSYTSGFHPTERDGERTFAWSSDRAVVRLASLDRRVEWTCTAHVRGARPPQVRQPELTLSADGSARVVVTASNEFQDIVLRVPVRPDRPGLTLTLSATPTFVPGPGDSRALGAQVDSVGCVPASGRPMPPAPAMRAVALGAAAMGLVSGLVGFGALASPAIGALVGVAQAIMLATHGGVFGTYPGLSAALALGAAAFLLIGVWAPRAAGQPPLNGATRLALGVSVVAALFELFALAHPAKLVIDAVFQAHRLEWVMGGRYFFTQPLPDGVQFPYAIGLYVAAWPWASLIEDRVLLLRVVVIVANAIAGFALFHLVVRWWDDARAGVIATTLFHVVPLTFIVIGNANLPNAFAQSIAVLVMATAAGLGSGRRQLVRTAVVALLAALAFLSHVSTLALLAGMLGVLVVVLFTLGGREGRRGALMLVAATAIAGVLAGALYYRHFPEVYARAIDRVRASSSSAGAPAAVGGPTSADRPAVLVRPLAWHERAADTLTQTVQNIGWPILILSACGLVLLARAGQRDRLSLLVAAWLVAWGVFLLIGTLTRVDTQYQRYAAEFIGRVNLAGYPVAVVLAARGLSWAWQRPVTSPVSMAALLIFGAAVWSGVRDLMAWIA